MRKTILDIPINWVSDTELDNKLEYFLHTKTSHHVTTVNPEFIVLAQSDTDFKHILQHADLSLADGTGIVLAQTYLDQPRAKLWLIRFMAFMGIGFRFIFTPQAFDYKRITGVDLTHRLLLMSQNKSYRIFLLGAGDGVAQAAAKKWQTQYPSVHIVGTSSANPDDPIILNELNQARPDVLLVAYGAPKQEKFIANIAKEMHIPIMVGVGGTFDYAVGNIYRPPKVIRTLGLEWLARLIQQPRRFRRIYRSTIQFISLLIH